ncbi:ATP-NAD kinase-like domain-containing protein [Epithele typhae]|uniref:ATP-NAD kinase-like domain-containing protein n=1 Tax=Epithele typhae TaxID=378194 RepID=UPI002008745B|nr:ATP-NAD kinase-like domain-containing protein [Epithele typhae]KAH9946049.1 ATP-NAD kinase-like domain-containing protein [Epithele typhae]
MSTRELALGTGPGASKFILDDATLRIERPADKQWPNIETPLRNVLWAGIDNDVLTVSLLARKKARSPLSLIHVTGPVADTDKEAASSFSGTVMAVAYIGVAPERRLKVFVNPHSGPGKAAKNYRKKIEPIFKAARCKVDLSFTERRYHARDLVKELPLDDFDAVVVMSGDGLIHEVLNGYAAHAEPGRAFRIPLSPIPTGSGNGLALNLMGMEASSTLCKRRTFSLLGKPMDVDMFSMKQGESRYISFMSQAVGLMADIDLGTEPLRWMGGQRFVLGFIYNGEYHKACPVKLSIKAVHKDKQKMLGDMHSAKAKSEAAHKTAQPCSPQDTTETGLPDIVHIGPDADKDGWITFDQPVLYVYAGKGPYVSADFVQFPVSLPNDGLIDVVVQERTTRGAMLKGIDGAEKGHPFWLDTQHYYKAKAYRIEPASNKGHLSIDGEAYPLEPYEVEVHQGLGCFLSMYGSYQINFEAPAKK